jgi:hypothetical protein
MACQHGGQLRTGQRAAAASPSSKPALIAVVARVRGNPGIAGDAAPAGVPDRPAGRNRVPPGRPDQMGSRGACFCRVQEVMCFSKVLRTLSSRGSTSVAWPTRVTEATLSPAWLRSTLARAICDP